KRVFQPGFKNKGYGRIVPGRRDSAQNHRFANYRFIQNFVPRCGSDDSTGGKSSLIYYSKRTNSIIGSRKLCGIRSRKGLIWQEEIRVVKDRNPQKLR